MGLLERTKKNLKAFLPVLVAVAIIYVVLDDLLIGNPGNVLLVVCLVIFLFGFAFSFLFAIVERGRK